MNKFILFYILIAFLIISCKIDSPTETRIEESSQIISALQGGEITIKDEIKLQIPAGALKEDTRITLTSLPSSQMHEWCIKSVHLEPDGLTLEKPAKLSFSLPDNWPSDHNPLIYVSFTENASEYFDMGICAEIVTDEEKLSAQTEINHFSKYGVIANCHKGTLTFLLDNFIKRGCVADSAWKSVKEKFPNTNTDINSNPLTGHQTLQAFLLTQFNDIGGLNANELTSKKWDELVAYIKAENKQVVALFTRDMWGNNDAKGIYGNVPHSAVIEVRNGKIKLRNSVSTDEKILIKLRELNGENVLWYPKGNEELTSESFDIFRNMKSGKALELELSNYSELFINWPNESLRLKPWTAVRFYVAKLPENSNPCITSNLNFKVAAIEIYVKGFLQRTDSNSTYEDPYYINYKTTYNNQNGNIIGNVFSSVWDTSYNDGIGEVKITGSINIEFSNDFDKIISYKEEEHRDFYSSWRIDDYKIEVKDIPYLFETSNSIKFGTNRGINNCQKILTWNYSVVWTGQMSAVLNRFECDENSNISIGLFE